MVETKNIMEGEILPRSFYTRNDATIIAKELLGKVITTDYKGVISSGMIVETEAYMGPEDLACHAHSNRRTSRTEIMYHRGGLAYVYICYGMHHLFNAVTGTEGMAHAVLVRAVQPFFNETVMLERRHMSRKHPNMVNGPGKLSEALGITKRDDGTDLTEGNSKIKILDVGIIINKEDIDSGPRVGMSHHTRHCGHYPWRFKVKNNRWTSKPDIVRYDW